MEDVDDDFGELYADFEVPASSAVNDLGVNEKGANWSDVGKDSGIGGVEEREKVLEVGINGGSEVWVGNVSDDSDDENDFDVVVNDEEYEAKNGGGDERRCREEADEVVGGVKEGSSMGKNQGQVNGEGTEQSAGGVGGERGNVGRSGCNSQNMYPRRYGSVFAGNQQAISLWKANGKEAWYDQPKISGLVPRLSGNGKNFWLPWYRTIVDMDMDMFEHKPWTYPGADITDYFNFGFDEESWRNFRWSLVNEAGATKELESEEFVDAGSVASGLSKIISHESDFATRQCKQLIGQAIHVENSIVERQPSMDARRSRNRDSDVVIQITVQDLEEPTSSANVEPDYTLETGSKMLDKGCDHEIVELVAEKPGSLKDYGMRKNSSEEKYQSSSASSYCKRSYESAAVSSHILQDSYGQGKDQNSELDQPCEEADTFSGGNLRAIEIFNSSLDDVDNGSDTTGTNPCVAGIDLSFDDDGHTSLSPSYSNTWSKASQDGDHCDSRRILDLRRSSPVSKKERHPVAKVDYHRLRNKQDGKKRKESDGKYHVRGINSIEEDLKLNERRVQRHLKSSIYNGEEHRYGVGRSRMQCRRSEEWCVTSSSDDEYWPNYRKIDPSFGGYDRGYVDNRFEGELMRDFDRRDIWKSRDEVDLNFQREWDEEQCFSDRRQRIRGVFAQKDRSLRKRECIIRDENCFSRNQHHMSKFSSSHDISYSKQQREYVDVHFDKRNKHDRISQHRYSDGPVYNRYGRFNALEDRQSKYIDSEIRHERHLWHSGREVGASGREFEYFENRLDVDYPQSPVDDADECWSRQALLSTHDYQDGFPTYGERRHEGTLYRDDMNDPRLYQRYKKHSRSNFGKKCAGSRQFYDNWDTNYRHDAAKYHEEDVYFEDRRNVFQSKDLSWAEDALFDGCSDNAFCGKNKLDSFEGAPRHNLHGVKHGSVSGGMTMHENIMKGKFGLKSSVCKFLKNMSTRGKHEENGLWRRNSVEVHRIVRKRKTLQSNGKFSKAGNLPNDVCKHSDKRFQQQFKRQQVCDKVFCDKNVESKAPSIEELQNKLPVMNHDNAADLEEGQIPTEKPKTENFKVKRYGSEHLGQKDILKEISSHSLTLMSQDSGGVYDKNRILETMAKMEKRRERFKETMFVKQDMDSDPKPEVDKLVETTESKGKRPVRKRKWG